MNPYLIIVLIFAVFIIISILASLKRQYRQSLLLDLSTTYERMELSLVKNDVVINNDIKDYLLGHKNYLINKELIDIEILLSVRRLAPLKEIEKLSKKFQKVRGSLPKETIDLEKKYTAIFYKLIFLSMIRLRFMLLFCVLVIKKVFEFKPKNPIKFVVHKLNVIIQQENVIGRIQPKYAA